MRPGNSHLLIPLGVGLAVVLTCTVLRLLVPSSMHSLVDGVGWTVAALAAGKMAWSHPNLRGVGSKGPERLFALSLTSSVIGQLIWDISKAAHWRPFPSPSDIFFLITPAVWTVGTIQLLGRKEDTKQRVPLVLDGVLLILGSLCMALALYLPSKGMSSLFTVGAVVVYPVVFTTSASVLAVTVLHQRPRLHASWIVAILSLSLNAASYLLWNAFQYELSSDGSDALTLSFSIAVLGMGYSAATWQFDATDNRTSIWLYDKVLRTVPIVATVCATISTSLALVLPSISESSRYVIMVGSVGVIVLSLVRQSLLVSELHQSETRYELAIQASSDGIWDCDIRSGQLFVSPRWFVLLGLNPEEFVPSLGSVYELLHPNDNERFKSDRMRHLETGTPFSGEYRILHRELGYRWYLVRGQAIWDRHNQPVRMAGSLRDVDDERLVEQTIRNLNIELEHRVALRTDELQRANAELESFAYSVSHDLRAPLRSISGYVGMLSEVIHRVGTPEEVRHIGRVQGACQRMAGIIDGLLRLSRVSRAPMREVPIDLSRHVRNWATEKAIEDPERDSVWDVKDTPNVIGDPHLLGMMLDNLLSNSWKYSRDSHPTKIEFFAEVKDGRLEYVLRDNGAGFDMTYAENLFTPFHRLHHMGDFEGNGIGLATVHRIIVRHEGTIFARAEVGVGAEFRFHLPGVIGLPSLKGSEATVR